MNIRVQTDFATAGNADIVTFAGLFARFDVFQGNHPLYYVFQPCRADETIIPKGKDAEKRNRKPDAAAI